MNIIICGAGKVGFSISKQLSAQGHSVTVIDQSSEDIKRINDTQDVKGIVGRASLPSVLENAGAEKADMVIAVTRNDETNMIVCQLASSLFNVSKKIEDSGNKKILLTERGASFGYNNLVSDMRSLEIMKSEIGYPVIFDATHSVQSPGGMGDKSGGDRKYVPALSKAATAVGVAGVFMETHNDPDNAPSDGPNMVKLEDMNDLIKKLIEIDNLVKEK